MDIFLAIIGAVAAIFIIIVLHEGGHFYMARLVGVRVLRFSIGFGKPLVSWSSKKTGTEYAIGWLPLGGYVKMHGDEDEGSHQNDPDSYLAQALWKRFLIVIAGPLVNFILALVIIWGLFLSGIHYIAPVIGKVEPGSLAQVAGLQRKDLIVSVNQQPVKNWQQVAMGIVSSLGDKRPVEMQVKPELSGPTVSKTIGAWQLNPQKTEVDPLGGIGISPFIPKIEPIIGRVLKNSPAAVAGLLPGERIVGVNGKRISDWRQLVGMIRNSPGKTLRFIVLKQGRERLLSVVLGKQVRNGKAYGFAGFMIRPPQWPVGMRLTESHGIISGWVPAWNRIWHLLTFKLGVLKKLVTGDLPMKVMGGPVSIFQSAGRATLAGWQVYWQFVAIISLSIGFINLLPIPGLDGGHILYQLVELLRRRPLSQRAQRIGIAVGMTLLFVVMVQVTFYDLSRLFNF